jgi:hypothetical protein
MEGRINDAEDCMRKALGRIIQKSSQEDGRRSPLTWNHEHYYGAFVLFWAKNSLLKELLSNIVSTLQVARELAKCCRVLSYSWKLMKQSDLDVLVIKLNFHKRDLQILIKSGLLKNPMMPSGVEAGVRG